MNKQRIEVMGRTVASPEILKSKDKKEYAKLTLAVNWKSKTKEGKEKEEATFYDVLMFGKSASKMDKLDKGQLMRVVGDLEARPYTSKKDEPRVGLTVLAREFQILDMDVFK